MNEKVRIITDSGCDISPQAEEQYKHILSLVPFEFTINGELTPITSPISFLSPTSTISP